MLQITERLKDLGLQVVVIMVKIIVYHLIELVLLLLIVIASVERAFLL